MTDNVNHPKHYQFGEAYEVIRVLEAWLTKDEFIGFCKGNAIKYQARHRAKGGDEDLAKALWYMNYLNKYLEGK